MKPVAMPPAVAASDGAFARAQVVDRTVEHDERQDVGLFQRRRARELRAPGSSACRVIRTRRLDAGVGNLARRGDVEHRIELGVAGEAKRAVAGDVELPALKLVRPANGVDGPRQRDAARPAALRTSRSPPTVMLMSPIAARVGPPGREPPAAQDEVVGNAHVHVEGDALEDVLGGGGGRLSAGRARHRLDAALTGACQGLAASPPRRCPRTLGRALGGHDLRQRLDAVRVVEQLQDPVDLEPPGGDPHLAFELAAASSSPVTFSFVADADVAELVVDDLEVLPTRA